MWMTETFFFTTLLSRGGFGSRFMEQILRGVSTPSIVKGAESQKFLYTLALSISLSNAQILTPYSSSWLSAASSDLNKIKHLRSLHKSLHHRAHKHTPYARVTSFNGFVINKLEVFIWLAQILTPFAQIYTPVITNPYTLPHKFIHLSSQILTPYPP